MNIERYRETVNELARAKSDSLFSNKGTDHALVVIEALLSNAEHCVNIFSGSLKEDFYGNPKIREALEKFLSEPARQMSILTENEPSEKIIDAIKSLATEDQVSIYRINEAKSKGRIKRMPGHFITADNQAYRFETSDESREAVVNFNDPEIATNLNKLFYLYTNKLSDQV